MAQTGGATPSEVSDSSDGFRTRHLVCNCAGINRYCILALSLLFLASLMSSLIAFNATFVSMMDKTTSPLYNGSLSDDIDWADPKLAIGDRRLSYGFTEKSLSFAGGFAGSTLGTIPLNFLLQRYGPHKVLTVVGLICTIAVAVTPVVACWSFPLFVLVRIISGISISIPFPVAGYVVNEWAPLSERGLFVAVQSAYVELSALITMPLGGLIATQAGWDIVFYAHAIFCGFFTILWTLYFRFSDEASSHPCVAEEEWKRISFNKQPSVDTAKPPIKQIFRSPVIWSIWLAVIGNYLVAQFLASYSTMYFAYVLKFPTISASMLTIPPLCSQLIIKLFTGLASDRISCLHELSKMRLFSSIALLGSGLFFIILCVVCPANTTLDVLLIVIPVVLVGFTSGGYPKCAVLVSRQHTPFVMSVVQLLVVMEILCYCLDRIVAGLSLLSGSFLVPALTPMTPQDTFDDWRRIFLVYAIVLTLTNTIFVVFARSEPAKWTSNQAKIKPSDSNITLKKEHI